MRCSEGGCDAWQDICCVQVPFVLHAASLSLFYVKKKTGVLFFF